MNVSSSKPSGIPNYTGPESTGSFPNPKAAKRLKALNKGLVNLLMRKEAVGTENIPSVGIFPPTVPIFCVFNTKE